MKKSNAVSPNNKGWLKPKKRVRGHLELKAAFPSQAAAETLTPNLRALRLAMTASDLLLSMGVSANSVVSRALDITEAFCDMPVTVTISYNLLTVSQVRGIEDEPLTLIRPVPLRDINNTTVQSVQQLIYEIRTGKLTLEEAEIKLDQILTHPKAYASWIPPLANAAIAPTVALMFTTNWRVIAVIALMAIIIDRLLVLLAKRALAPFFRQAIASFFVTLVAAAITWLARRHVQFFDGMNATTLVVCGIFLLVSGLAVVGAVQDALEEYYITASARLTRVGMLTTGIVTGILIGLYTARKLHMGIVVSPDPLGLTQLRYQVIGGGLAAAAFAIATHTRLRAVLWAAVLGGGGLVILYSASHQLGVSIVPASGVAAACIGLVAALFSRLWRAPASGIISCGIIPLVPGLAMYTSLMQLINYPPGHPLFFRGIGTFTTAIATALSIAIGASLGYMLGRPLHRHMAATRNFAPFAEYVREQLHAESKTARLIRLTKRLQLRQTENIDK